MANSMISISLPRCFFSSNNLNSWLHHPSQSSLIRFPSKPSLSLSSSSPSSASVVEEDPAEVLPLQSDDDEELPFSGCRACGRDEIERGCNGEGRIQGGIATVPGFGWWPIKAYRPCPQFLASGGRYRRTGQSMDEVAFGRGQNPSSSPRTISDDAQQSKKKPSPKKFKR